MINAPKLLAIALSLFAGSVLARDNVVTAELEGIADGDTIYVRDAEQKASYRVRMASIDAPEKSQEYGVEAKAALAQLLRGVGRVTLHVVGQDKYKRTIAMVEDERGRNINLLMVSQGAAWVYDQFATSGEARSLYPTLKTAESNARKQQLGLWAYPDPIEPWRYRRMH